MTVNRLADETSIVVISFLNPATISTDSGNLTAVIQHPSKPWISRSEEFVRQFVNVLS
jgi:hypothetical protein